MPRKRAEPMTIDDVAAAARELEDIVVGAKWGNRTWMVGERGFAWQRPFSKADLARFGDDPIPQGDILAVRVANLDAKDALLELGLPGFFTIPHFNGYAAVLIELRLARAADVRAALTDAWRAVAAEPARKPRKPRKKSKRS